MTMTYQQRVKVKAALSMIALHGHNPRPVQANAKEYMAKGVPAPEAYTLALNAFAARIPAMRQSLEVTLQLVGASDEATLAQYDAAMTAYNETGDASHFDALVPMIVEDAKALAIRNGEVSEQDALYWDIQSALGLDEDAIAETPDVPDARTAADGSPMMSSFAFANSQQQQVTQPQEQGGQGVPDHMVNPGQISLTGSPTGYCPGAAKSAPQVGTPVNYGSGAYTATGYRPAMSGEKARQWQGTPTGDIPMIRTETGYRAAPSGEQARREAGVPIG